MKPTVVLIDLSSLFFNAWYKPASSEVTYAQNITLEAVHRCMQGDYGQLAAICCDLGRSFRKDISKDYKSQRDQKPAALLEQLRQTKQRLIDEGFLLWESDGFEADDIIATACEMATAAKHEVVIASADKDLLQLVCPTVKALRTHLQPWKVVGQPEVVEKFGVEPYQLADYLALVGDTSDNVKGADGIGSKTAAELLKTYGGLRDLYIALAKDPGSVLPNKNQKPGAISKAAESLIKCKADVELARKLVALNYDAPIKFEQIYEPRKKAPDMSDPVDTDFDDVPISAGPSAPSLPPTETAEKPIAGSPSAAVTGIVGGTQTTEGIKQAEKDIAPTETALVPVEYTKALEPQSMDKARQFAKWIFDSRLYSRFPGPEAIFAVLVRGRELGLGAMASLDAFHVVEGKPCPHAHLIISLAENHPDCEYMMLVASDNEKATYETKNKKHPKPITHTYTIQQAIDSGYCQTEIKPKIQDTRDKEGKIIKTKDERNQWDKMRAAMLRKTCGVQLARIAYPSAALGLYSYEEMGGEL